MGVCSVSSQMVAKSNLGALYLCLGKGAFLFLVGAKMKKA